MILSENYAKLWFFCQKNWDIWNPKLCKTMVYYFFFIFLAFLVFFSPIQTCQKIMKFFVVLY